MKHRPVRVAILAAVAVGVALTQQACSENTSPTAAPASADVPTLPSAASTPAPGGSASARPAGTKTGTKGATTVTVCRSSAMSADITFQPERTSGATRMALVALTNKSSKTCRVAGRAAISLTNAAGEVVGVPTREVGEPGTAVPITLKPGRTAFEGIKWTTCDKAASTCHVGNGMRFNLEASTDGPGARLIGFPAAEKSNITIKSLSIGTLQPSTQGVVAW
jgi:hypothetical protein